MHTYRILKANRNYFAFFPLSSFSYYFYFLCPKIFFSILIFLAPVAIPSSLQRVKASNVTSTTVILSWVLTNQTHVIVMGFEASCSSAFPILSFGNGVIQGNSTFSVEITGLEEYVNHICCVYSVTNRGNSSQTCVNVTTLQSVPNEAPPSILLLPTSPTSLFISWDNPPLMSRNGIITQYIINITALDTSSNTLYVRHPIRFFIQLSLHPYYTYDISIAAATNIGHGPFGTRTIRMPEAAPSGAPQQFNAAVVNSTAFKLTWNPPELELQNGLIRHYVISINVLETQQEDNYTVGGNLSTLLLTNLHPFYNYNFLIRAVTIAPGIVANVSAQLPEGKPSVSPSGFVVAYEDSNPTSVQLSWKEIPMEERNGIITGYVLTIAKIIDNEAQNKDSRTITLRPSLFIYAINDLMLDTVYNISLAAQTSVGLGPVAYEILSTIKIDIAAPEFVKVTRTSAQEIQVSWNSVKDSLGIMTGYVVKYRPVVPKFKRNTEDLAVLVEINQTGHVIAQLDPRLSYGVSVAVNTRGGAGNFSNEIITDLYSNSEFGVHMSGAIVCLPWLSYNGEEKLTDILDIISAQLAKICSCPFTMNYVANARLTCGDGTTDRTILQGALVALPEETEIKLHEHLQDWVDTSPSLEVTGVALKVVRCSTYPADKDSCVLKDSAATDVKLRDNKSGVPIYLYGGIGGAAFVILLLICIVLVLICGVRRKRSRNKRTNINATNITNMIMESNLDDVKFEFSDDGSHIYEIPDALLSDKKSKDGNCSKENQVYDDVCNGYSDLDKVKTDSKEQSKHNTPTPYQIPSSLPVRHGPHLDDCKDLCSVQSQGYDLPRSHGGKPMQYMALMTNERKVENVYEGIVMKSDVSVPNTGHEHNSGSALKKFSKHK